MSANPNTPDSLSPSQVRCFMDCQVRWCFKYKLKVPDAQNGKLALGKAIHSALTHNFHQKIDTREDLQAIGVRALVREAWASECLQTEFAEDEDPAELLACGESLVWKYTDEVAPQIDPAAVEMRVEGEIGGVKVQGWVDLVDTQGRIIEFKTASRKPSRITADQKLQLATYALLTPGSNGSARLDTLVKTKSPAVFTHDFTLDNSDIEGTRRLYAAARDSMREGSYMPNRLSLNCSRRNCSYWRCCEREWGGAVPEK